MENKFKCLHCGRDKFTQKGPHICNGTYRKRGLKWTTVQKDLPLDITTLVEKVIPITGRGNVHMVTGLRKDFRPGMLVRYQGKKYEISGVETAGIDREVPEILGILLKKISPIPDKYPNNLEECMIILSKGHYKSSGFPFVFLDYNYTYGTWSVSFRNPVNFDNPGIAEPTPLKAVHKMFDFLKTREYDN